MNNKNINNDNFKYKSMYFEDIITEAEKELSRMKKIIFIKGKWITIKTDCKYYNYDIELSRIKTSTQILFWANHLSGKYWMDCEKINYFIELMCDYNKIKLEE